jgi:hypothetical protein
MLSVWDMESSIDLWTKEMPVDEMKIFFSSDFSMSDTFSYRRRKKWRTMKDFCELQRS